MAIEIERKFLVQSDAWRQGKPTYYCQGYLNRDKLRTVRVRVAGERAMLTIKGPSTNRTRAEFEYEIPLDDARELLELCEQPLIEKNRWVLPAGGKLQWEVDEFLGDNAGLVVAEIEVEFEEQTFERPDWLGEEVTDDHRYFNSRLSALPYKMWATES